VRKSRRVLRQGVWAVVGQAASSLTNLLIAVAVARTSSAEDFGIFSLVFTTYLLALRGSRAIVATPLLIASAGESGAAVRRESRGALGASLITGGGMALILLVLAVVTRGSAGEMLVCCAVLLPGLLLQDIARYCFFAQGRAPLAAGIDVLWLVLQGASTALLLRGGFQGALPYLLSWGLAASLAGAAGVLLLRCLPSLRQGRTFFRTHRRLVPDLVSDYLTSAVTVQMTPYVVALAAGVAAAGALRAGLVLAGLLNVVVLALKPIGQLEASRLHKRRPDLDNWFVILAASMLGAIALVYSVVMVSIPDWLGEELLGETWNAASELLVPLAVFLVARSPYTVIILSLRARLELRALFLMRVVTAPLQLAIPAVGAVVGGALGAAWGLAAASAVASVFGVVTLVRVVRRQRTVPNRQVEDEAAQADLMELS
jgi:O-antigen/teichoic acid export membrane protein